MEILLKIDKIKGFSNIVPTQKHHKALTTDALDGVVEFCGDFGGV